MRSKLSVREEFSVVINVMSIFRSRHICQAFTRTSFGDRPAGLTIWPILTKSHWAFPYGLIQLRLCPISLHLCKMCEFYATCKLLKLTFRVSIELIQSAKREVTNEC